MTQGVNITFYPLRASGTVSKGITILDAARLLGVNIEGPCSGVGRCGKDLVQVRINKTLQTVLACKTEVESDIEVTVPSYESETLKTVEGFYTENIGKSDIAPLVIKKPAPTGSGGFLTKVYANDKLLSIEEGDTKDRIYGAALDIGTTTLAASLIDLNSGETLKSSSILNPLVFYGHDVMSRIKYSLSQKDGLSKMHRELISAVNLLIESLSFKSGVSHRNIYHLIAAGNTTMQHIFLNKEIKGIGEYPYKAEVLDSWTTAAESLGIEISDYAPVTTLPCISAYVGGDIVSGLAAVNTDKLELPALFLDIGTNGEIALLLNDGIIATSTAAGPCFEGMTISSGMRAVEGAVEHVGIEEEMSIEVIGNGKAKGICGSGLMDLVSELLRTGLVNSRGRLQGKEGSLPSKYKKHLFEKKGKRFFCLTDDVSISQEDIRQVQLAKAAIRAGIEILLGECNIEAGDIKEIIIAGGFGYHLKESSLFGLGLLPETANARISFVGNSSLGGAARMLLNKNLIDKAAHLAKTSRVIELSQIPAFESRYIKEIHF